MTTERNNLINSPKLVSYAEEKDEKEDEDEDEKEDDSDSDDSENGKQIEQDNNHYKKAFAYELISENVEGMFYVDIRCIGCSLCAEIAPAHFATNHDEGYEYVYCQPVTEAEINLCKETVEICPVNAIGVR